MSEGKFLNSEQAKAEEEITEVETLKKQLAELQMRVKSMGEMLAQYALQKAELELQLKEMQNVQRASSD